MCARVCVCVLAKVILCPASIPEGEGHWHRTGVEVVLKRVGIRWWKSACLGVNGDRRAYVRTIVCVRACLRAYSCMVPSSGLFVLLALFRNALAQIAEQSEEPLKNNFLARLV